jgi:hypothetical protein
LILLFFSLCDSEELYDALFERNTIFKVRDEFGVEIIKVENKVRL